MLTDDTILEVIDDCQRRDGGRVRGVAVRRELMQRFGARASTDRIYRLLREHQTRGGSNELLALQARVSEMTAALQAARNAQEEAEERARLAEHREEVHLVKWARELHELREKVAHYEGRAGLRTQAQFEAERLRSLVECARHKQTISKLTALLDQHGIAIPPELD